MPDPESIMDAYKQKRTPLQLELTQAQSNQHGFERKCDSKNNEIKKAEDKKNDLEEALEKLAEEIKDADTTADTHEEDKKDAIATFQGLQQTKEYAAAFEMMYKKFRTNAAAKHKCPICLRAADEGSEDFEKMMANIDKLQNRVTSGNTAELEKQKPVNRKS